MKTLYTLFYTAKRTLIILAAKGIKATKVVSINISRPNGKQYSCVHVVYATVNGTCSLLISCKEYLNRAIAKRRESAAEYTVTQRSNPSQWDVVNSADLAGNGYTVVTTPHSVTCDCEDFKNQEGYLSQHRYLWNEICKQKRICKHSLAVIDKLGFGSLRDYLAAWREGGKFHQLQQRSAADDLFQQF